MVVIKLNVKRATERRPPQNITIVNQPFDNKVFNFTKIKKEEILFQIEKSSHEGQQLCNGEKSSHEEQQLCNGQCNGHTETNNTVSIV